MAGPPFSIERKNVDIHLKDGSSPSPPTWPIITTRWRSSRHHDSRYGYRRYPRTLHPYPARAVRGCPFGAPPGRRLEIKKGLTLRMEQTIGGKIGCSHLTTSSWRHATPRSRDSISRSGEFRRSFGSDDAHRAHQVVSHDPPPDDRLVRGIPGDSPDVDEARKSPYRADHAAHRTYRRGISGKIEERIAPCPAPTHVSPARPRSARVGIE